LHSAVTIENFVVKFAYLLMKIDKILVGSSSAGFDDVYYSYLKKRFKV